MRFSIVLLADAPWPDLLDLCRHAEATGWDGVWFPDHFMPPAGDVGTPMGESWTTLAALAASVPRIRLGHLVNGNTYRHPAVVAKMAATVDHVSGGRFTLGLGAGWQENEHVAYGIPFHTIPERARRLAEACQVIRSLFTNERTTFRGRYYQLTDAPLEPKPIQKPLPILVGAGGEKLGLRVVARHADAWNTGGLPDEIERKIAILDRHCAEVGRNPREIRRSAMCMFDFRDGGHRPSTWYETEMPEGRGALPVIAGDEATVRDGMRRFRDLGLDELVTADLTSTTVEQRKKWMDRVIGVASEFREGA